MKIFRREEIERVRVQFIRHGYEQENGRLDNASFNYFVLPQYLNENLPNFVVRVTGKNLEDGEVYGISESVTSDFRRYMVFHEVVEFRELPKIEINRCKITLEREISNIPREIKSEYLNIRKKFFEDLIKYGKGLPEIYTEDDIEQWRCNARRIEGLLKVQDKIII